MTALLIAAVLWAAIYLPGLGSQEFKGEEGRRVMPAVTMLEGGSLIVPHVGGKPFLRKPPLVQWTMAGSMALFGQNAWAARLPSALSVLALAAVIIFCTRGWLSAEQALLAAVALMSQIAMIEKCRLAELEAVYVGLCGAAMVVWMGAWSQDRAGWRVWIVPCVLNGLAILAKAPMHLIFFYAIVIASLAAAKELRRLWSWPHLVGLALMVGVVLAWYVPYRESGLVDSAQLSHTLKRQAVERFTGAEFRLSTWLMNIPNGLGNHLPWVLFAPLLWRPLVGVGLPERTAALLRGARWAVAGCFVVLLLIPGVLPRYLQPLAVPFSLLLAPALWESSDRVRRWWQRGLVGLTVVLFLVAIAAPAVVSPIKYLGAPALHPALAMVGLLFAIAVAWIVRVLHGRVHEALRLGLWTGMIAGLAMVLYAIAVVPWMRWHEDLRPFAARIDAAMPAGETLVAYGLDDFAPLLATLFYLETTPYVYAADAESAPEGEHFYLVRGKDQRKFRNRFTVIGEPLAIWQPEDDKDASAVLRAVRTAR